MNLVENRVGWQRPQSQKVKEKMFQSTDKAANRPAHYAWWPISFPTQPFFPIQRKRREEKRRFDLE